MVKEEKIKIVEELIKKFEENSLIALFDIHKIPTKVLKEIKKIFGKRIELKIVKKNLLGLALEKTKKKNLKLLANFLGLQPALIFANENPFKLFREIESIKVEDYAKEGEIVENDIVLKPGPTDLAAGPVIGELSRAGIPVGIESGKIVVRKETTIAKKGEKLTKELAAALRKLGIKPMKIGIKIECLYFDETLIERNILNFVNEIPKLIEKAYFEMINFSVNINWIAKETIKYLLIKAYQNASIINSVMK